ncbi:MAG: type II/IV secretion system protein [Victivallales bacterium]|nr:type II/IV secretion system protein [Victivallales bacterium]
MGRVDLSFIEDKLSRVHPAYKDRCAGDDRAALDWGLCAKGVVSEQDLLNIYAGAVAFEQLDEDDIRIPQPFKGVSIDYLNSWCCIPYSCDDDSVELLVCDPYSLARHQYMFQHGLNLRTDFRLARRSVIERLINDVYNSSSDAEDDPELAGEDETTLRNLASEAKIVRLVNEMFTRAAEQRASDIHVEPEEERLVIRFRIDGILHEYTSCPLSQYPAVASRIKLVGGLNIAESRLPQDGRTNIQLGRNNMDIRISTIPTMNGESIVLRLLRKDSVSFDLGNVGMSDDVRDDFEQLVKIPHGIILVVGPTGSGKTTTLYSVITMLNDFKKKIITIEDPVEYRIDRLSQMQVNAQIGLTFANGLRSIVRQDPDVILVGEIRDRETADIAVNAALTGHLVLSTLHTNDAPGAVSRMIDMGVEGFLLASALYGVLSQRLVRKICLHCEGSGIDYTRTGNKCRECNGTGFHGRMGIFELMLVDDEIRSAISRNASSSEIAAIAMKKGMRPLVDDGMKKVAQNLTTEAEVKRAAMNFS